MTATASAWPEVPIADPTRVRIGRVISGLSIVLTVVGAGLIGVMGRWSFLLDNGGLVIVVAGIGFGALAWAMLVVQPANNVVWVFVWSAFFSALAIVGQTGQAYAARGLPEVTDITRWAPADMSVWLAIGMAPAWWAWGAGLFLPVTLGMLLFPDGRLAGPRWRLAAWASVLSVALITVAFQWEMRPTSRVNYDFGEAEDDGSLVSILFGLGFVGSVACGFVAIAALILRYRRSPPEIKRQIRMVVVGLIGFLLGGIGSVVVDVISGGGLNNADTPVLDRLLLLSGYVILLACFAIAILKYRLYDLDVVISKAFSSLVLAAFISLTYVGLVVGVGGLVGGESGFALSIAATTVVAIAFQPVRRVVQRAANRLVYGDRASPYEVLARFGHRATESSDEDLIDRVPELVVGGTGAAGATLWLRSGQGLDAAATWPPDVAANSPDRTLPVDPDRFVDPEADRSIAIIHDGELLGGLSLVEAHDERLSSTDEQVVAGLVSALGLALRNARLRSRLRARVAELDASRQRVLAAADEARRSLERDLDRGPQRRLTAIEVGLGEASDVARGVAADPLATILGGLAGDAAGARGAVRDFARGVYPRRLEADGLSAAIADQAEGSPLPLTIVDRDQGRHGRDIEAAVYFTVLEAYQNAIKHAEADSAALTLAEHDGHLTFELSDDGCGFDPTAVTSGAGLGGLTDRMDAVGGTVELDTGPGRGTIVRGSVPAAIGSTTAGC